MKYPGQFHTEKLIKTCRLVHFAFIVFIEFSKCN